MDHGGGGCHWKPLPPPTGCALFSQLTTSSPGSQAALRCLEGGPIPRTEVPRDEMRRDDEMTVNPARSPLTRNRGATTGKVPSHGYQRYDGVESVADSLMKPPHPCLTIGTGKLSWLLLGSQQVDSQTRDSLAVGTDISALRPPYRPSCRLQSHQPTNERRTEYTVHTAYYSTEVVHLATRSSSASTT